MEEENKKTEVIEKKEVTTEKKKSGKKIILIIAIILAVVIFAVIGGILIHSIVQKNKSVGTDWGDVYYSFLEKEKSEELSISGISGMLPKEIENEEIQFCELEKDQEPLMVLTYTNPQENRDEMRIYYITGEGDEAKVGGCTTYYQNTELEFLYNIETQEYDWYIHTSDETTDNYTTFSRNSTEEVETKDYIFTKAEMPSEKVTEEGEVPTISKFEETFITPEVEENKKVKFDLNGNLKDIKQAITEGVKEYKDIKEITTEEVKNNIATEQKALETKKEEIKKAEEEAKKKAEEEAKKRGLQVGPYTLKYGTYKSELPQGEICGGVYIINQDGTFSYENTWSNINGEVFTTKRTGTFETKYSEGDDYDPTSSWMIIFHTKESNEKYIQETDAYDIDKDNHFTARQYLNNWIYTGE